MAQAPMSQATAMFEGADQLACSFTPVTPPMQ
jgi:hypothetical protein